MKEGLKKKRREGEENLETAEELVLLKEDRHAIEDWMDKFENTYDCFIVHI